MPRVLVNCVISDKLPPLTDFSVRASTSSSRTYKSNNITDEPFEKWEKTYEGDDEDEDEDEDEGDDEGED